MITCPICPGSALTLPSLELRAVISSTSSLITRRSIFSISATEAFKSSILGASICRRPKARSWWVKEAARPEAFLISWTSPRCRSVRCESSLSRSSALPMMTMSMFVEVVGHPAGQSADRLQLLRLAKLLFKALALQFTTSSLGENSQY